MFVLAALLEGFMDRGGVCFRLSLLREWSGMGGGLGEYRLKLDVRFENALPTSFPRAIEGAASQQKVSAWFRQQDATVGEVAGGTPARGPALAGRVAVVDDGYPVAPEI